MAYYRRRFYDVEAPKIEVPTLDQNQLLILSSLFILNATEGYRAAELWLADFEDENLLPTGSLSKFLDFFDAELYIN